MKGKTWACVAACAISAAAPASARAGTHWVATWGASIQPDSRRTLTNVTVRNIIHISVGGPRIRLRISNAYGRRPAAHGHPHNDPPPPPGGRRHGGPRSGSPAAVVAGTQTQVTFGGKPTV